jgi:four helix bundle protein
MNYRPYQNLVVWKEAHQLCLLIYQLTISFPTTEKYSLVTQMRRSSSSVPTNLAEGSGKSTPKDQRKFYTIARGSLEELHYQCILSKDLTYISKEQFEQLDDSIKRTSYLLNKLRSSLIVKQ